jgi:hypothetical protein
MASTPNSGEISMNTLKQVFGPARSPGDVDDYGNYSPGPLRFPGPPGDIDSYRDADNDELEGTSNMPSTDPGEQLEMAHFYGKTCPVYGAYIEYSIYEYPAYSYFDENGEFIEEPSEEIELYPGDPFPDPKSYDNYREVTIDEYGTLYSTSTTPTKVDWNYGYSAWFDNDTQEYIYGPFTNEGEFNERVYEPAIGDDTELYISFTEDYEPPEPTDNGFFPYYRPDPVFGGYTENYFEFNKIYSFVGIIDTTTEWQLQGTYEVNAALVRNVYGVKRLN